MAQATFDFELSQQAKETGMQRAVDGDGGDLSIARSIAVQLARKHGETNSDAVGEVLEREHGIKSLGPAAGALFKERHWVFTGQRIASSRVSNHGRELKVWRLRTG